MRVMAMLGYLRIVDRSGLSAESQQELDTVNESRLRRAERNLYRKFSVFIHKTIPAIEFIHCEHVLGI